MQCQSKRKSRHQMWTVEWRMCGVCTVHIYSCTAFHVIYRICFNFFLYLLFFHCSILCDIEFRFIDAHTAYKQNQRIVIIINCICWKCSFLLSSVARARRFCCCWCCCRMQSYNKIYIKYIICNNNLYRNMKPFWVCAYACVSHIHTNVHCLLHKCN